MPQNLSYGAMSSVTRWEVTAAIFNFLVAKAEAGKILYYQWYPNNYNFNMM